MSGSESAATRLKTFMLALQPSANSGALVADVFAGVLGLSWPDDYRLVLRRLADVADLAHEVRLRSGDAEQDAAALVMLADFDQIERVVSQFPMAGNLQMSHLMNQMTDAGWRSLDLAELLLRQREQLEPVLDEGTVQRLLDHVRGLIDEVASAEDFDETSRSALVRRLRAVEEALLNVKVTGTVGVEVAAEGLVGHVINLPSERRSNPVVRKAAELGSAALIAAAAASGAMVPQLLAGTGGEAAPAQPPAVVIIDQVVPGPAALPGHVQVHTAIESGDTGS